MKKPKKKKVVKDKKENTKWKPPWESNWYKGSLEEAASKSRNRHSDHPHR